VRGSTNSSKALSRHTTLKVCSGFNKCSLGLTQSTTLDVQRDSFFFTYPFGSSKSRMRIPIYSAKQIDKQSIRVRRKSSLVCASCADRTVWMGRRRNVSSGVSLWLASLLRWCHSLDSQLPPFALPFPFSNADMVRCRVYICRQSALRSLVRYGRNCDC
jgi:hypothetical protein